MSDNKKQIINISISYINDSNSVKEGYRLLNNFIKNAYIRTKQKENH